MSNRPSDRKMLTTERALRIVAVADLQVDPSYQRCVKPNHKKIARDFDPNALGVPLVGQREDHSLWIVDGQQRVEALKLLGKVNVRVEVFASKGPEHEAHVFKLVNCNRTKLHSLEEFWAKVRALDDDSLILKRTVEQEGFKIVGRGNERLSGKDGSETNGLACVNTLARYLHLHGPDAVRFALRIVRTHWGSDPNARTSHVLAGLSRFWSGHRDDLDEARLGARLVTTTPSKILVAAANGLSDKETNVHTEIERMYKKRLRKVFSA